MNRFLRAISILDHEGHLSLSNLAMFALLIKVMVLPDWPTVCAFILAVANYAHKRQEVARSMVRQTQVTETQTLTQKVDSLSRLQEGVASQAAETKKQQEEMKKLLSSSVLVNSFKPPVRRNQVHAG